MPGMKLVQVGNEFLLAWVIGDANAADQLSSVLSVVDARSLAGKYGLVVQNVPLLLNAAGTLDRARSAPGTTGIPSVNTEGVRATYSHGLTGFLPVATPTDFWAIIGSANKIVRVLRVTVSGIATAAASVPTLLLKRSTANTGSTPVDPTDLTDYDSNDGVPTAVIRKYTTTNPTTGTLAGTCRAKTLNLGAAGAAGECVWDFTTRNGKGLVLRGVAESLNLNWAGAAVPSGTLLSIDCEWSEET